MGFLGLEKIEHFQQIEENYFITELSPKLGTVEMGRYTTVNVIDFY